MRKKGVINFIFISLSIFAGTIFLYALMGVIPSEGFNPSDDGVILAQSFRLLQGQIPHLDFISIRPVGSALLHSIHFIIPLPLEISARWFTLLQYLTYSMLWAWIMVRFTRIRKYRGLLFFTFLSIWGFILNQNFYNLFPWTTIDSLFWIVLALSFYLPDPLKLFGKQMVLKISLIVFFSSMAALSRQTFFLPAFILLLHVLYLGYREKKWTKLIISFLIGLIPAFVYLFILIMNAALPLMLDQLSGRTELFETGFRKFYEAFWETPVIWVYLVILFSLLIYRLSENSEEGGLFRLSFVPVSRAVFALAFLLNGILVFMSPENLFAFSFISFFLLLLLWVSEEVTHSIKKQQRRWFLWILLISWTSAISLGDNAPVFAFGLLNTAGLGYLLFQLSERGFSFRRLNQLQGGLFFILILVVVFSIKVQKKNNYRDLASSELKYELGEVFPEFGKIRTNELTHSYMLEIDNLYKILGFPRDRFVVLPNSAIIYPIIPSTNPLALDWMQGPEFVGSEESLLRMMEDAVKEKEIFFLIDKFDSKRIADSLMNMDYSREMYPYMERLLELTEEYPYESRWFNVRVSK